MIPLNYKAHDFFIFYFSVFFAENFNLLLFFLFNLPYSNANAQLFSQYFLQLLKWLITCSGHNIFHKSTVFFPGLINFVVSMLKESQAYE